jgi:predicted nucleotidyltransferase
MKTISKINLAEQERNALLEMKRELSGMLPASRIILYGSKARGDSGSDSDLDLLILVNEGITSAMKEKIRSLKYDLELKYDIVIGLIIENTAYWQSPRACSMPLHWNIDREGVSV